MPAAPIGQSRRTWKSALHPHGGQSSTFAETFHQIPPRRRRTRSEPHSLRPPAEPPATPAGYSSLSVGRSCRRRQSGSHGGRGSPPSTHLEGKIPPWWGEKKFHLCRNFPPNPPAAAERGQNLIRYDLPLNLPRPRRDIHRYQLADHAGGANRVVTADVEVRPPAAWRGKFPPWRGEKKFHLCRSFPPGSRIPRGSRKYRDRQ